MANPNLPPGFGRNTNLAPGSTIIPQILQDSNQPGADFILEIQNVIAQGDHGLFAVNIVDTARSLVEARARKGRLNRQIDDIVNHASDDRSFFHRLTDLKKLLKEYTVYEHYLTQRFDIYSLIIQTKANNEYNMTLINKLADLTPQVQPADWNNN
jgi:hypothetical protein